MRTEKEWTILIYANGNNDLEPEINQAVENIKKTAAHDAVNVVIELGRAEETLVKLLRKKLPPKFHQTWHGVRRYLARQGQLIMLKKFKQRNMANPENLLAFIKWGLKAYPAKRYMLIVGGHGYQFVGSMTDYTQDQPCIMGIPEMVKAIDMAGNAVKRKIDVVLLDICYFNFIEVLYELGKSQHHTVQNALTYVFSGPIAGLPYYEIVNILQKNTSTDTQTVLQSLIDNIQSDLVSFSVNHARLNQIKERFNEYALEIDYAKLPLDGSVKLPEDLSRMLFSLVLHYKKNLNPNQALIAVAKKPSSNPDLIERYNRLGFAQHNHWTHLLSNKTFAADTAPCRLSLSPLTLSRHEVGAFLSLMNPDIADDYQDKMLEELFRYKNWH